jgi:aminoglycoside phosphotransferase (APT) family kinase protein
MENAIKVKLSLEEIQALTRDAFGVDAFMSEELTDGWANSAYRVELRDGRKTVLKVAPVPGTPLMRYEVDLMRTEVEAMRLASSVVPVPEIYRYDTGKNLIPSDYFFMEWLDGVPYNKAKSGMSEEERFKVEEELGRLSRRLNSLEGERFGSFAAAEGGPEERWSEVFRRMIQGVLDDGKDKQVVLPFSYEEAEREINSRLIWLAQVHRPCLVHWDLWDGNVFVRDGQIVGLIDFERAFWGDPLMEFYFGRMCDSSAFRLGYGTGEASCSERRRRLLYDFYLDLILVIECSFRHYENQDHIRWALETCADGWRRLLESQAD